MMKLSTTTAFCLSWAIVLAAAVPLTAARADDTATANDDVVTPVAHTSSGINVADVSLKYGASAGGLDLSSSAGAAELEKRVYDAAQKACSEIAARYPNATTTSDWECVKDAVDKAMVRVRQLVAEAHKKSFASR